MKLSKLKNLAEKSETQLSEIGIHTAEDLRELGSVEAYVRLKGHYKKAISLNFLYAMEAALRNVHWREINQEEKLTLQTEVEATLELYSTYKKFHKDR